VGHDLGKPAFYIRDVTFTHVVVDIVPVPLSRQAGDYYTVLNAGTSKTRVLWSRISGFIEAENKSPLLFIFTEKGKIYKIVQWRDTDGNSHSELIDIIEGTYPESVRAMEISSMVRHFLL